MNVGRNEQQLFHLVSISPWPLALSLMLSFTVLNFLLYGNSFTSGLSILTLGFILFNSCLSQWFSDIIKESTNEGYHNTKVQNGLRFGMGSFIISEILFFFSFFWAFFYSTVSIQLNTGSTWPVEGIDALDPWSLTLVNTLILLSSGYALTWSHRAIPTLKRNSTINGCLVTVFYGILFTCIQYYEYSSSSFRINESIFGSLFYMLTGFHGLHVLIGSIFLIVGLFRSLNYQFTNNHHVGYECSIWYWHFVDVVWLYLFIIVYIGTAY